jgi:predicted solute-binding protein
MLSRDDAALVIGDPALSISREGVYIYDLGEMWVRRTGLPFVFAFWAVRPGVDAAAVISLFEQSKSCGIGHLNEICRQYALRIPLSIDEIYDYLRVSLDFELGKQHQLSLQLFYEKAYRCGLLPSMRPLEFLNI